jgi:hypothetical protein
VEVLGSLFKQQLQVTSSKQVRQQFAAFAAHFMLSHNSTQAMLFPGFATLRYMQKKEAFRG